MKETLLEKAKWLWKGDVTVKKRELGMACIICLLTGILAGLLFAPVTQGISIGSHNGSGNCDNTTTSTIQRAPQRRNGKERRKK